MNVTHAMHPTIRFLTAGPDLGTLSSADFMQDATNRPRVREDLSARLVKGETVVLDRSSLQVHQFNATASHVWSLCTGRLTEAEIASRVAETYDVEPAQAAKDVQALVAQFRTLGLLGQE